MPVVDAVRHAAITRRILARFAAVPSAGSVAVEGNQGASAAACCTVPSVVLEATNPLNLAVQPGEAVEVTDGVGTMALGASAFLLFPVVLFAVAAALLPLWWVSTLAVVLGLVLAATLFRALRVDQFPKLVRRLGPVAGDEMEKEYE